MENTRLMERLFSATDEMDAELTEQVANDIEAAHEGVVETEELVFEDCGDGRVIITDKENGEKTVAEKAEDGNYDLSPWMEPTEQLEQFIHPEGDGVTPGPQMGEPDEKEENHMAGAEMTDIPEHEVAEEEVEEHEGEVCPECGKNPCECEEESEENDDEAREFSVATDNTVVQRIFSDQAFCERLFSEVIESEETAKIGDLKVEKVDGEDAVIVTSESTGDKAKVELDDENMNVTELAPKAFSEEEDETANEQQFEPLHVVGVDAGNHVLVDAAEYDGESAEELAARLSEEGVDAIEIFENEDEARDYAMNLLETLGADEIEDPEEKTFSDHTIYVTRYYSDNTCFMDRLFSEACNDVEISQDEIEHAIESGEQIENDEEIITPLDAVCAIVEDKNTGEFTKVYLDSEVMNCQPIEADKAEELMGNLEVAEEEKEYSDIYANDEETKFFSEGEEMTDYMVRLFSDEASEKEIEDAIESGEQIENDTEVITPVDAITAVIEDKENGEFTKAVMDDEKLDLEPISEEEADKLTEDLVVEDKDEDEEEDAKDEDEEEKEYSTPAYMDKFFAEVVGPQPVQQPQVVTVLDAQGQPVEIAVDENGQPMSAEAATTAIEQAQAQPQVSVEAIEDKALAAVQSIQAAAAEAQAQILNAKAAPAEGAEQELQEAQFSDYEDYDEAEERTFSDTNDTLVSWLNGTKFGR